MSSRSWSPYIYSFYAYDSNKGDNEHVKTYIYNGAPIERYLYGLKYKIEAEEYRQWHDWTLEYSHGLELSPYSSYVVHDYLNPLFEGADGVYALNARSGYQVTQVYARGGGWSHTYYPSYSQGFFEVNIPSGTYYVFMVSIYDPRFITLSQAQAAFSDMQTHPLYQHPHVTGYYYGGIQQRFSIYVKVIYHSYYFPYEVNELALLNSLREEAASWMGLTYFSDPPSDPYEWHSYVGTSEDNHGYDCLMGFVYDPDGPAAATHSMKNNYVIYHTDWDDPEYEDDLQASILHEFFHTYGAFERDDPKKYKHVDDYPPYESARGYLMNTYMSWADDYENWPSIYRIYYKTYGPSTVDQVSDDRYIYNGYTS